ncbi:MAG: sugar phosphate nucleotidyltransferase [Candidatus Hodarchaeota archaeon]
MRSVSVIIPCGGNARRMLPLSNINSKPFLPVLDSPLIVQTIKELKLIRNLKTLIFIVKNIEMENQISSLIKRQMKNLEVDLLFLYRKPENDILDSIKITDPYINGDLVAILMPDIFNFSYQTNILSEIVRELEENDCKTMGIIGIALSDSDQKSNHSYYLISKSGELKGIKLDRKNPIGIRSAGRYILPSYILRKAIEKIPYYTNRERKVEDIFNILIKWKMLTLVRFFGRISNVNTPQDLFNVNMIALKDKKLVNYFGTSYVKSSSIKKSIISSHTSIIESKLENCLVLPDTNVKNIIVKDSIIYENGIIPVYNKKGIKA